MREADMLELLRQRYTKIRPGTTADRFVRAAHVRLPAVFSDGFGYGEAERIADYLTIDTYGAGQILGHEVKVSRADWLRELADPSKAEAWRRYCHRWFLVASEPDIVRPGELPDGWGLMVPDRTGRLRVKAQSPVVTDPAVMEMQVLAQFTRAIAKTAAKEETA